MKRSFILLSIMLSAPALNCADGIAGLKDSLGNLEKQLQALTAGLSKLPKPTAPTETPLQAALQAFQTATQKILAELPAKDQKFQQTTDAFFDYDWEAAVSEEAGDPATDFPMVRDKIIELTQALIAAYQDAVDTTANALAVEVAKLGDVYKADGVNEQTKKQIVDALRKNLEAAFNAIYKAYQGKYDADANVAKRFYIAKIKDISPDPYNTILTIQEAGKRNRIKSWIDGIEKPIRATAYLSRANSTYDQFAKQLAAYQTMVGRFFDILKPVENNALIIKANEQSMRLATDNIQVPYNDLLKNIKAIAFNLDRLGAYYTFLDQDQTKAWIALLEKMKRELPEKPLEQLRERYAGFKHQDVTQYFNRTKYLTNQFATIDQLNAANRGKIDQLLKALKS